ncbi:MAG: DUF883 family protein [Rhodobiaceae bacterium]|nr:DUF883 family protein [Rhodobiaceae bacterium]
MNDAAKTAADIKDVEEQIKEIRAEMANLGALLKDVAGAKASEARGVVQGHADDLIRKGRDAARDATERAKGVATTLEDHIVEKPVQSALIALLVGVVIGSFGRR